MTATFGQASYVPGQVAQLEITANTTQLTAQPIAAFSSSQNPYAPIADDPTVGAALTVRWHAGAGLLDVRLPRLPSGVYFMRVTATTGQAVAPFVVRPAHLGTAPVAVIIPTYTWQAYNRLGGGTWYACACVHTVDLLRPYLSGGVPYNFGQYDRDFLR